MSYESLVPDRVISILRDADLRGCSSEQIARLLTQDGHFALAETTGKEARIHVLEETDIDLTDEETLEMMVSIFENVDMDTELDKAVRPFTLKQLGDYEALKLEKMANSLRKKFSTLGIGKSDNDIITALQSVLGKEDQKDLFELLEEYSSREEEDKKSD